MSIPVFAEGANPNTSAPLFYSKIKSLQEGMKRLKIRKIGAHYFRATQASFVAGPRPIYEETETQSTGLAPAELPGIRFKSTAAMTRSRLQSQVPQLHLLPRLEWEGNLAG